MVRTLMAVLFVLLVAVAGRADPLPIDASLIDANGQNVSNYTFRTIDGDSTSLRCGTRCVPGIVDTLGDNGGDADTLALYLHTIDPDGLPAWLNVDFAAETNAKTAWFKFWEHRTGSSIAYSDSAVAGEWVPLFLNGSVRLHSFEIGLWDSAWVVVSGSADGIVELAWTAELIR